MSFRILLQTVTKACMGKQAAINIQTSVNEEIASTAQGCLTKKGEPLGSPS